MTHHSSDDVYSDVTLLEKTRIHRYNPFPEGDAQFLPQINLSNHYSPTLMTNSSNFNQFDHSHSSLSHQPPLPKLDHAPFPFANLSPILVFPVDSVVDTHTSQFKHFSISTTPLSIQNQYQHNSPAHFSIPCTLSPTMNQYSHFDSTASQIATQNNLNSINNSNNHNNHNNPNNHNNYNAHNNHNNYHNDTIKQPLSATTMQSTQIGCSINDFIPSMDQLSSMNHLQNYPMATLTTSFTTSTPQNTFFDTLSSSSQNNTNHPLTTFPLTSTTPQQFIQPESTNNGMYTPQSNTINQSFFNPPQLFLHTTRPYSTASTPTTITQTDFNATVFSSSNHFNTPMQHSTQRPEVPPQYSHPLQQTLSASKNNFATLTNFTATTMNNNPSLSTLATNNMNDVAFSTNCYDTTTALLNAHRFQQPQPETALSLKKPITAAISSPAAAETALPDVTHLFDPSILELLRKEAKIIADKQLSTIEYQSFIESTDHLVLGAAIGKKRIYREKLDQIHTLILYYHNTMQYFIIHQALPIETREGDALCDIKDNELLRLSTVSHLPSRSDVVVECGNNKITIVSDDDIPYNNSCPLPQKLSILDQSATYVSWYEKETFPLSEVNSNTNVHNDANHVVNTVENDSQTSQQISLFTSKELKEEITQIVLPQLSNQIFVSLSTATISNLYQRNGYHQFSTGTILSAECPFEKIILQIQSDLLRALSLFLITSQQLQIARKACKCINANMCRQSKQLRQQQTANRAMLNNTASIPIAAHLSSSLLIQLDVNQNSHSNNKNNHQQQHLHQHQHQHHHHHQHQHQHHHHHQSHQHQQHQQPQQLQQYPQYQQHHSHNYNQNHNQHHNSPMAMSTNGLQFSYNNTIDHRFASNTNTNPTNNFALDNNYNNHNNNNNNLNNHNNSTNPSAQKSYLRQQQHLSPTKNNNYHSNADHVTSASLSSSNSTYLCDLTNPTLSTKQTTNNININNNNNTHFNYQRTPAHSHLAVHAQPFFPNSTTSIFTDNQTSTQTQFYPS